MDRLINNSTRRHQCQDCIYVYNPGVGDPNQGIKPGTPFESLPDNWVCPVCNASKRRFKSL